MPKFDYIIGNPPYAGNLHLKILDAVKDYGEKVIWLHPGGWLYSEKQVNFIKHFKVLDYFSQIEFRKLFNAESQNGAIISIYDKDIIEPEYNELYCKYGKKEFVQKLHELKTQIFAKMKTADNWNNRL